MVWFNGSIPHAREKFIERGELNVRLLDAQCNAIALSGLPAPLPCVRVEALSDAGIWKAPESIAEEIFGCIWPEPRSES